MEKKINTIGKVIITSDIYTRDLVQANPKNIYVFGDNTVDRLYTHYVPSSTQAVIRGLENTLGLDTKLNRYTTDTSYLTDDRYNDIVRHYDEQFKILEDKLNQGYNVVFPQAGIGTGKAQLPIRAPKIYEYLRNKMNDLYTRFKPQSITYNKEDLERGIEMGVKE